ncbi:MAG: hypothetical protein VX265_16350 [Myxococcota bacterium]|nr:hypothetical protein [Myxococcota bacterium]MEC8423691.1 hypothetical protein [Myxococcota bacterium]
MGLLKHRASRLQAPVVVRGVRCGLSAAALVVAFGHQYWSWSERAHHAARAGVGAREPLVWIQHARAACLAASGAACDSLADLVDHGGEDGGVPGRDKIARQLDALEGDGPGIYRYALMPDGRGGFAARASRIDGEETWQIGPSGGPTRVTPPRELPGGRLAAFAGWLSIGAFAVHLATLLPLTRHVAARISKPLRRRWVAALVFLGGLLLPVMIGLALLLMGRILLP